MSDGDKTIEAEIVEIDGVSVDAPPVDRPRRVHFEFEGWRSWGGKVRKLDARWMPVWIVLGAIALVFVVAIGMCLAVVYAFFAICRAILQGIVSLFIPSTQMQRR